MIAVQNALVNHVIKRETTLDLITVSVTNPIHKDISLDNKAITRLVLIFQVFTNAYHGHCHFMPQHDRVFLHIAVDAGMVFTLANDFDV